MIDPALQLLVDRGADELPHPGGTLGAHLRRVGDRLAGHGVDDDVRRAGLCHAAYGTDGFPHALLGLDERPRLRSVIGTAAEAAVYRYAACQRSLTYPTLADDPVRFADRFTRVTSTAPRADLRAFAALTVANELDVLAHADLSPADRAALGRLFASVSDLLTPAASAEAREAVAALTDPRP